MTTLGGVAAAALAVMVIVVLGAGAGVLGSRGEAGRPPLSPELVRDLLFLAMVVGFGVKIGKFKF